VALGHTLLGVNGLLSWVGFVAWLQSQLLFNSTFAQVRVRAEGGGREAGACIAWEDEEEEWTAYSCNPLVPSTFPQSATPALPPLDPNPPTSPPRPSRPPRPPRPPHITPSTPTPTPSVQSLRRGSIIRTIGGLKADGGAADPSPAAGPGPALHHAAGGAGTAAAAAAAASLAEQRAAAIAAEEARAVAAVAGRHSRTPSSSQL
jgi:hypothetical protein